MTQNGQRITPLMAAKQIYVAFGEQAECMGSDETLDHIRVEDATKAEQARVNRMVSKVAHRVRKVLGV
jgi:hypothetical protein